MQNLSKARYGLAVAALLLLLPAAASAQSLDPIIGTWNLAFSREGMPTAFIAVMTFHYGGTTVEFDTNGTNSSASPGESIALGVWSSEGGRNYSFREENVIYDSSGNLSSLAIGQGELMFGPRLTNLHGTITLNFYSCSLAQCPGPLIAGPSVFQVSATRF